MKNTKNKIPAVLGGKPAFRQKVPITKPTLAAAEKTFSRIKKSFQSGMITNADNVKLLEEKLRDYLKVKHVVAINSCTSGLMLLFKSLKLKGEVILPSFTFSATGHAVLWNNLTPVFVDCDKDTANIDVGQVKKAITPRACAILGVHVFGNPANVEALQEIAKTNKLWLFFDAAHGLGAFHHGKPVGSFGDAEVFSMSPTKLLTSGEGGLVATNNDTIAYNIKIGRSYADPGDYNTQFEGLNARMSEFNAIVGLENFSLLRQNIAKRQQLAKLYIKNLSKIKGLHFQKISPKDKSSYKDFSVVVDKNDFGISRNQLLVALEKENIVSKKYFYPALHHQKAFSGYRLNKALSLANTEMLAKSSISLPLYSHMPQEFVEVICSAIEKIHKHARTVAAIIQ